MRAKIKSFAKTVHCGYIYEDGHAVIVHEDQHPKAGRVQWVEIIQKVEAICSFTGRIVFHNPSWDRRFILALTEARIIRASAATTNNGSENTKKLGLEVGSFSIEFKGGGDLHWVTMPNVISSGLTYQPETREAYNPEWNDGVGFWGTTRIAKVHRVKPEPVAQVQAAAA